MTSPQPQPLRLSALRARGLLALLCAGFVLLAGRAAYLQGLHNDFLQQEGESRYSRIVEIPATRGMITDRNLQPLAVSTPVESVWASPADVAITSQQMTQLARLLELTPAEVAQRLSGGGHDFVYLKRQLPPEQAQQATALDIPGIFLQREYRRYYPASESAAQVVGITDIDGKGQEGLELGFDSRVSGLPGSRRVIKDRRGRIVEDVASIRAAKPGQDLTLSIDANIQYLAYRELKKAVVANRARAGSAVVLDVSTGEVLAMADFPSYNPNNREQIDPRRTRNRAVTDLFEPGSTLKPFTVAAALESGLFSPDSVIRTAPGRMRVGNRTIHDVEPSNALTVTQVIQKSSNVGAAKMGLAMPAQKLWEIFNDAGFGAAPRSDFPGEVAGRLRAYRNWQPIDQAAMSYGYGISVSLLQLARAYLIFATDGEIRPVTLLKQDAPVPGVRVIDAATAREVRQMLERVVEPGGTAPHAQIVGYRVAGKTGTAHKLGGDGYATDKFIASFVGLAPASAPRLVVAVAIDEPSAGQYYGGAVAAPVFGAVTAGALRILAVPPDAPLNNVVLPPPGAPTVREET
ncbi:MAG TPA: penicillin-binding transpeptidase domain-containing protein [Burkholderiales bacterium]|nr:penicillin-binding transpeptidase domain-containing protein [Burkholderiales bacterium]